MGETGRYLLYFAAAYLGFRGLIALVVFVQLLRVQLWPARVRVLEQAPGLEPGEAAAVDELRALGFEPVQAALVEYGRGSYKTLLLRHASEPAFAHLSMMPAGNLGYPVGFYTFRADGKLLATSNRMAWSNFGTPAEVLREDPCTNSLAAHWEAHRARLKDAAPANVSNEEAGQRLNALTEGYLPLLQAQGRCTQDHGAWHPSVRAAAAATLSWVRLRARLAKPYVSPVNSGENQVGFFVHCYTLAETLQASRPSRHNVKASVLVLSILAALLLWGLAFSWSMAVMLIVILFVHESGHALMMRLFGYQDMSMFFIPFIGAMVTGKPKELPAWKQAVILFAGPVPGLLAGLAILLLGARQGLPDWGFDWRLLGSMAVGVNLFNLLPITPLDGGQLMGISLFNRWPLSRLLFAIAGVAGIGALALWLKSPATIFITLALAMGLRSQLRMMQLHRAWDETLDRQAQLRRLFETAKRRFKVQTYATQAALVKAVMNQHAIRRARWWESALIVGILLVFWSGAALVGLQAMSHPTRGRLASGHSGHADTRTPAQLAFDTAFDHEVDESDTGPDLGKLEQLAQPLRADDPRRVDLAYLRVPRQPFDARRQQLEAMLGAHVDGNFYTVRTMERSWLQEIYEHAADAAPAERAAVLTQAIERGMRLVPTGYADTVDARLRVAESLDQAGDTAKAGAMLQALHERASRPNAGECRCKLPDVVGAQSRFALAHQHPADAVSVIESSFTAEKIGQHKTLSMDYAWALLSAGRVAEGVEQMRAGTSYDPPQPGLLQRAFNPGERRSYVYDPLNLAYAWHLAGQDGKIRTLDQDMFAGDCERKLDYPTPLTELDAWEETRETTLRDFARTVCPRPGPSKPGS